jgi:hypothetical protein
VRQVDENGAGLLGRRVGMRASRCVACRPIAESPVRESEALVGSHLSSHHDQRVCWHEIAVVQCDEVVTFDSRE